MDGLMVMINANPKSKAYIRISIDTNETFQKTKQHIIKIAKHFKWRNKDFDLGRLIFAIQEIGVSHSTTFYIIPDGAKLPKCDEPCTVMDAKDLYVESPN